MELFLTLMTVLGIACLAILAIVTGVWIYDTIETMFFSRHERRENEYYNNSAIKRIESKLTVVLRKLSSVEDPKPKKLKEK